MKSKLAAVQFQVLAMDALEMLPERTGENQVSGVVDDGLSTLGDQYCSAS